MPNRRVRSTDPSLGDAEDLEAMGSIEQGLALMSQAGANVEGAAWDKVVGRFSSTRSKLSPIEWSEDFKQARSWAAPSEGGDPYRVAVWIVREQEESVPELDDDPLLAEFWTRLGWRAMGGCQCKPFA